MPAGLNVFNTWGTIQVDENYRNYGFRNKFTVTMTDSGIAGQGVIEFTTPGTPALLVACHCTAFFHHPGTTYYDGTNWRITFYYQNIFFGDNVTAPLDFYIFDVLETAFSNVGMEVFNASGQRVFHSDANLLRIGDDGGPAIQSGSSGSTGTPGRIYAPLIMLSTAHGVDFASPQADRVLFWMHRSDGHTILAREGGVILAPTLLIDGNAGLYAALDVTDYT